MGVGANFHGAGIHPEQRGFNTKKADANQDGRLAWEWTQGFTSWLNEATGGTEYRSGKLDTSPQSVDHMLKFMGGGVLQFGLRWQNMAAKAIDGKEIESRDIPFWRRFYKQLNPKQSIGEFYDAKQQLEKYQADFVGMRGIERTEYLAANKDHLFMARYAKGIDKQLRSLNKSKRSIGASKLSEAEKDRKLEMIDDRKIDATTRFAKKRLELGIKHL